ncbi:hypothetical protein EYC80_009631 [Monilinia laxa]|uniref:Uncharacterized protein n=1 Tax=Monilinia laxa TaxID=61186 RepID=A0A5N6JYH4_MONLA|nr:hypothetical protein EYC80_009631 [Monilinia laxa]
MAPKAFEAIKAKFKALLKGKKSKKAEADPAADATKTDAAPAPATATSEAAPATEATAPEGDAAEPSTATETPAAPTTADHAPAVVEPANTTEPGEPSTPYMIGTLVRAQSTDTEIAAPEASKDEEPVKTEPSAPILEVNECLTSTRYLRKLSKITIPLIPWRWSGGARCNGRRCGWIIQTHTLHCLPNHGGVYEINLHRIITCYHVSFVFSLLFLCLVFLDSFNFFT